MEKKNSRKKRMTGTPLKIVNFLRREGRRCCAVGLCISMVLGNVAQAAVLVDEDPNGTVTYDLDSISLYGALQAAVLEENLVEKEFDFEGEQADAYTQLLGETENLYELKPELEGSKKGLELRIFARLDEEIELDRGYRVSGDEEIVFVLTNQTKTTKKAILQIDGKRTEEAIIVPDSALSIAGNDAYLSAADLAEQIPEGAEAGKPGSGSGGAGGGGGSGKGDGIRAEDSLEGMEEPKETDAETEGKNDQEETSGIVIEVDENQNGQENNGSIPDVNIVGDGSDTGEEGKDTTPQEPADTGAANTPSGEGTENSDNQKDSSQSGSDQKNEESDNQGSNGGNQEDNTGNQGSDSAASGNDDGNQGEAGGDKGTADGGNDSVGDSGEAGNGSSNDQSSDNSSSGENTSDNHSSDNGNSDSGNQGGEGGNSGNEGDAGDGGASLALSSHRVSRVALGRETEIMATPSNATPSDITVEESDATPSDAQENLLEGTWYEPVAINGRSTVAFVTTAAELGLDNARFQMLYIYEPEVPVEGVKVRVGVSPTAFPEGQEVKLQVKKLEKEGDTADQYQRAEEELAQEDISYEGMVALDISFLDENGEEIEPEEEALVSIKMDRESLPDLPEGITPEAISVQHHKEIKNEDGTVSEVEVRQVVDPAKAAETTLRLEEAETVSAEELAEMAGGIVEMRDEELVTEFSVESFSTFTITWWGVFDSRSVNVHYVDEEGKEITCDSAPTRIDKSFNSTDNVVTLSDYAFSIDGYIYHGAYLGSVTGKPITKLKGVSNLGLGGIAYKVQYTSDGNRWENLANNSDIYLVYKGSAPIPPTPGQNQDMTHDKKAERRSDGTYDLTLTVSGAFGSESRPALLDVIYVVDESNSMLNFWDKTNRFTPTKEAIKGLTDALAKNPKIDSQFSVVTFSGDTDSGRWNDAQVKVAWTKNTSNITNVEFQTNGGTNYQAGIRTAKELLLKKRENATTAVIFISDGDPTYYYTSKSYYDEGGITTGNGGSYDWRALDAAKTEVSTLDADYFFAVGVGSSKDYQKLGDLASAAPEGTVKKFFSTSENDQKSLTDAFNEIQDSVTAFLCSDVTVADTLSDAVKVVTNANNEREALEILVIKEGEKGEVITVASGNSPLTVEGIQITAGYKEVDGKTQIYMDFPESYELKKGYTYQVKAHVEATEAAYEKYRSNEWNLIYQDNPETGTGTHADKGEQGIYSNTEAMVSYKYRGESKTEEYPKPVIQLAPGELRIEKTITGLDNDHFNQLINGADENSTGLSFKTTFSWEEKTDEIILPLKELKTGKTSQGIRYEVTKDKDGKYTILFKGLSPDTRYTVAEENADVEGYSLDSNIIKHEGMVGIGGKETVSFTNSYNKKLSLTIKKIVTGNMGDSSQPFEFTYQVMNGSQPISGYRLLDKDGNEISITGKHSLKSGENFTISDIPAGSKVIVTETGGNDYTTEISKTGKNDWKPNGDSKWKPDINPENSAIAGKSFELTMTDTEEVTFTNNKSISSPTGIHTNRIPHLLLLAMAAFGMAGMAATGTVAKARKKNEEQ